MRALWIPMIVALVQSSSAVMDGLPDHLGRHRTYWPDGTRRLDAHYEDDAYDGEYRTWYSSGQPAEVRHFVRGRESGRQQAWTPTGVLYLNYEVRNGRHYGLINARPCLPIHEARS